MLRKDKFLAVNIREYLALGTDDEASQTYTMSAYLIAQLGKNFTGGRKKHIRRRPS